MSKHEVRIPDIGDAEGVEVIEIAVTPGMSVELDDLLIVIESDKASMEIPAPVAGTVVSLDVAVGDEVHEGQLIAVLETVADTATGASTEVPAVEVAPAAQAAPAAPSQSAEVDRVEVKMPDIGEAEDVVVIEVAVKAGDTVALDDLLLVVESDKASMEIPAPVAGQVSEMAVAEGDGVVEGMLLVVLLSSDTSPPADADTLETAEPLEVPADPELAELEPSSTAVASPEAPASPPAQMLSGAQPEKSGAALNSGPAVRRLARELGVDLGRVTATGSRGRIVKEDVDAFVRAALQGPSPAPGGGSGIPSMPDIDFSKFGPVENLAMSRIRVRGAANLTRSWLNVPHVTQHDDADVTDLEAFRSSLKNEAEQRGVKVTPLAFIVKAVVAALQAFPNVNASLDPAARHLIVKRYHHIGLAVDTDEGLVVPVLRDADRKGIFELAGEIADLSERARQGKLAMDELSGGSFSISSLGPIGGTAFTPIVNAPEVGILGVSRLTVKPHWNGESFEPRKFLPMSLSYDHRAINGAEAGRFMVHLCGVLGDMRRVLL